MVRNGPFGRWAVILLVLASPYLTVGCGSLSQFFIPGLLVGMMRDIDIKYACLIVGAAFISAALLLLKVAAAGNVILLVQILGCAILLLFARSKVWSGPKTFLACLIYFLLYVVSVMAVGSNGNLFFAYSEAKRAVINDLEQAASLYNNTHRPEFEALLNQFKTIVANFLPSLVGLSFLTASLVNVFIGARLIHKGHPQKGVFGPEFPMWKMPDHLVWLGILAGALALFGQGWYVVCAENCLLFIGGIYFVQGLSVMSFFFKVFNTPAFIKWPVIFLLTVQWYGILTVATIGLFDVWFDFRSKATMTPPRGV
ncbi:MAG: DUF2232 domain-containing protein [Dissulfurimicrobium sp.]|uniref:DUF2232 domain-containing protein n=1 Tax=Dissulfurimicrobium hydrothermale TaxID=1750598 RepID=UPI003C727829